MLVTGPEVVRWVAAKTNEFGNFGCAVGIGWMRAGEIVGGVAYNDFNGVNLCAHIALEAPLTREFLWAIFDYPFRQAKVKRLTGLVGEGNEASRRLCKRLGFSLETRLLDAHPSGDLLVYRLWRKDCKWLGLKNEKHA